MLNTHAIALNVSALYEITKLWLGSLEKSDVIFYLCLFSNKSFEKNGRDTKNVLFDTGLVT